MKKILFIDPLSPIGHINYNNYWFESLKELGYKYDVILREKYKENFLLDCKIIEISEELYKKVDESENFFLKRYYFYKILKSLNKNNKFSEYELIIFSSFENFSFFVYILMFGTNQIYAILHNNVQKIENIILKIIIKIISMKINLISLDKDIQKILLDKKIKTFLIRHPLPKKMNDRDKEKDCIRIFSPSKTSVDEDFLEKIFKLEDFFEKENIQVFLRSSKENRKTKNIIKSLNYLSQDEYEKNFLNADIIILPYKITFKNRLSNIFFEAISNDKIVLVPEKIFLKKYVSEKNKGVNSYKDLNDLKEKIIFLKIENKVNYKTLKEELSLDNMILDIKKILKEHN